MTYTHTLARLNNTDSADDNDSKCEISFDEDEKIREEEILDAVEEGDQDTTEELLQEAKNEKVNIDINYLNEEGCKILINVIAKYEAEEVDIQDVKSVLACLKLIPGYDINYRDEDGDTALDYAKQKGRNVKAGAIKVLLKNGAVDHNAINANSNFFPSANLPKNRN